jgi:outer membrane protein assembly factor BamB/GT2 family glycosyltransferase
VLDNASCDGSVEAVTALGRGIRLLARETRTGKAENDSTLLQTARGDYCLLLNEDAELLPGAVEALMAALDEDPGAASAGARLLFPDGTRQQSAWRLPGVGSSIAGALFLHKLLTVQSRGSRTRSVGWTQSSAMLVRRAAAEQVGWLDSAFFVYSDETDFCKRLRDAGWRILWVPAAQALHHDQLASDATGAARRIVEFQRNRDRYMRKHHSPAAAAIGRSGPGRAMGSERPPSASQSGFPRQLRSHSGVSPILHAMLSWLRRRWRYVAALAVALVVGGVVVVLTFGQRPGDVHNAAVPFTAPTPTAPPPPPAKPKAPKTVNWLMYGYNPQRTRYMPAAEAKFVKPPFRTVWTHGVHDLMEFQPVIYKGTMFFITNNGTAYALRTSTGRTLWKRKIGSLAASSPAWYKGHVFFTTLSGRLTAMNAANGRILWARNVGARTESPPLVYRGRIYFGAEDGAVYALRETDGKIIWTYHASADVTAGPAFSKGLLYFGDYGGNMQAVRASNGSLVWKRHEAGLPFGRSGGFYGTPAVAFGRVYVGNLDRKVYSFSASSGNLAWSFSTGGYVYAAPAVAAVPGVTPSVFIGSYDQNFYALNARTGAVRWRYAASGPISGAGSVIGRVVYFSTLQTKRTYGLDVRNGKLVFSYAHGAYNPAVSDGQRLYITGHSGESALEPRNQPGAAKKAQKKKQAKRSNRRKRRPSH